MVALSKPPSVAHFPWWATAYHRYLRHAPNHRGKGRLLRWLHRVGVRQQRPFVWRMQNGVLLAISPTEGFAPWSVGWTCFEQGVWEPHVEQFLRGALRPGDTAMDVGANIGYFSAVMAQCVGAEGRVWSFEPVPPTFEQLSACASLNVFQQLKPQRLALGAEPGTAVIHYDPKMMGSASIHPTATEHQVERCDVTVVRLDDLIANGTVTAPRLMKVDVEGHELSAFRGAQATLRDARPTVIFEFNRETASAAGWTFDDLAALFRACAPYRFYRLDEERGPVPVDTHADPAGAEKYVDLVASCDDLA